MTLDDIARAHMLLTSPTLAGALATLAEMLRAESRVERVLILEQREASAGDIEDVAEQLRDMVPMLESCIDIALRPRRRAGR